MRFLQKVQAKQLNYATIAKELAHEFFPDLRIPGIKIVDRLRSTWLGRCETKWNRQTGERLLTTILIQKSIMDDETTLKRILAHELVHAWENQVTPHSQTTRGRRPRQVLPRASGYHKR